MKEVYIVAASRTPIGSFLGSLSTLTASELGAAAIKGVVQKANIDATHVQEVIMGNVLSANLGQAPARQACIYAGLREDTICTTINKVCASGMKAVMFAAQSIMLGYADCIIAGGMESMSNVPYYVEKYRQGQKFGHTVMTDGLIKDGLWDVYNNCHMGNAAELTAREMHISRQKQDEYAIKSYKRAAQAWQNRLFQNEISPIVIQSGKESVTVSEDEEYTKVNFDKIPTLKPVFEKDGSITAANASTLNDGAAALLLMSKEKLEQLKIKPLAKILSFADAEQDPKWFTTSPSLAIPKALKYAKLNISDIQYFEINEAFSVVALANLQKLNLTEDKVNIWGGAVSLGHPIGCSGARIIVTLLSVLAHQNATLGVAAICNGGGGGSAIVLEKL
ncbi:MAG: acetyl-CoA C-acyltransferase [Cytophagaceae bacterium]|nr:acetyl-CoA C-acyltransferase [Cytophagaceae bacterium]MDW8455691.1 acetyl-CoA C-acyltransferase [Cytophagaceae bacterium]